MSITEFLEALSNLSPRAKKKVKTWLTGQTNYTCPLTSVCKRITNANIQVDNYERAAKKIGISKRTAVKIAEAADGEHGRLRNKMLVAVGLEPESLK